MQSWQTDKDQSNLTIKEQSFAGCSLFFKDNIYLLLGIFLAVAICMYGILGIYGFSAFPDEFGYWSPAAAVLGYDWSQITSLGSYYSYGYSILLVPVLFLFHGPIVTYRAAVILNLFFQCASFPLLFLVLKELFAKEKKQLLSLATVAAILYPAWLFYVQTTMAEALLYFLFILETYLLLRFVKKPGILSGFLFAIVLVYMYLVHMRCLGTIVAGAITLVLFMISRAQSMENINTKTIKIGLLIIFVAALFGGSFILKDKVIGLLYQQTSSDVLSWNDYSGIAFRIKKILSPEGILHLFEDVCGKVLYMGLATYGIAYFGIYGCARRAFGALKNVRKKQSSYQDFLSIYIFFAVFFQFCVALIYLNGASSPESDRMDNFLHGRYIDFFLPILIAIGIVEAIRLSKAYLGFEISFAMYLILGLIAMMVIAANNSELRNAHGFTMVGMSYLLEQPLTDPRGFFAMEFALQTWLTMLAYIAFILAKRLRQDVIVAVVLVMQIVLGVNACTHFIFKNQSYIYPDILLGEKLEEICQQYPDRRVLSIYEGGVQYIELVQFTTRDRHIEIVDGQFADIDISLYLDPGQILILDENAEYIDTASDFYEEEWKIGHMNLYYSP